MQMASQYQDFLKNIQQNNRLRAGLWLILVILLYSGYSVVIESLEARKENVVALQSKVAQLNTLATDSAWGERANTVKERLDSFKAILLTAETLGLAPVVTQKWIEGLLQKHHLEDATLQVGSAQLVPDLHRVYSVGVQLSGSFDSSELVNLMVEIESPSQIVFVNSLKTTFDDKRRFTLSIEVYCLVDVP